MKKYKPYKKYITIRLDEELRLSDLKKHAGLSDFTTNWKDKRQAKGYSGVKGIKIKKLKINRRKDYITFVFTSEPTYSKTTQAVDFPNLNKTKNVRAYTQEIRILDFFAWAKTKPGYKENEMTWKEIKEILNVAALQLSCSCMSFEFQGMNAILTTFDASIYPEDRMPQYWDRFHNDNNFVCKHLSILITSALNIYINNMTSMINKYLKGKNNAK